MSRTSLLSTAQIFINSYNTWSKSSILSFRAPNCIHQILPASTSQPPMNNEAYAAFLEDILPIFRDMHLTVHDTTIDEVERRVVMHVSSKALTVMGEYANEYIFSLWMTEDGKTVERVEEFADSKYSADYFGKLGELVAGMEAADNKGAGVGSLG